MFCNGNKVKVNIVFVEVASALDHWHAMAAHRRHGGKIHTLWTSVLRRGDLCRHAVTARLGAQPIERSVSLRAGRPGCCTPPVGNCYCPPQPPAPTFVYANPVDVCNCPVVTVCVARSCVGWNVWGPGIQSGVTVSYRGADKSLARLGRKQATATEDFDLIYPIYNHNWRNISTIYIQGVPGGMWNTSGECSLC